jgi:hypothetical protein
VEALKRTLRMLAQRGINVKNINIAFRTPVDRFLWRVDTLRLRRPEETTLHSELLPISIALETRGVRLIDEEGRYLTSNTFHE